MVQLHKDPKGDKVFSAQKDTAFSQGTKAMGEGTGGVHSSSRTGSEDVLQKRISELEDQIMELKVGIGEYVILGGNSFSY